MAKDDAAWAKLNARTAESVEEKLKRKAEIYEKLQKGKTGGLTSAQLDNLLVDVSELSSSSHTLTDTKMIQFDSKDAQSSSEDESDEGDEQKTQQDQVRVILSFSGTDG
jgi:hypothetical protein